MACLAWTLDVSCCTGWDKLPPAQQIRLARIAVDTIWALTGRRFNVCPVTIRPCPQPCTKQVRYGVDVGGPGWRPALVAGKMMNLTCGCGPSGCSCRQECRVRLDPGPVHPDHPVTVQIGSEVLPESAYQVIDGMWLVRTDGGCWPSCQAFDRKDGQPGAWSVTYHAGLSPTDGALAAASTLLCEMGKACVPNSGCRLPQRIQSIVRDGVSVVMLDPQDYLDDLLTALPEVDLQIKALNPYGLPDECQVTSPDLRKPSRVTWSRP